MIAAHEAATGRDRGLDWLRGPLRRLLLAYVTLFAAYTLLAPPDQPGKAAIANLGQMVTPTVATVVCWLVARAAATSRDRHSWGMLGAANALWVAAQAIWSYYELVLRIDVPTPSLADVFWALYYFLAFAGLMLQSAGAKRGVKPAVIAADAAMMTLAVSSLSWHYIMAPALRRAEDPLTALVSILWPLGDLLLVFALTSLVLQWLPARVPSHVCYLLAAAATDVVVDTAFAYLVVEGTYQTGHRIDALWPIPYALVSLAALASRARRQASPVCPTASPRPARPWARSLQMLLPYLSFPLALSTLHVAFANRRAGSPVDELILVAISISTITWIVLRHVFLLRNLDARTFELSILHEAATRLSCCATGKEVLTVGLELACEATRLPGGAVWIKRKDDGLELVSRRGWSSVQCSPLDDLPDRSARFRAALASGEPAVLRCSDLAGPAGRKAMARDLPEALLLIPLVAHGEVLGAFGLFVGKHVRADDPLGQVARAIASTMGVALENVRRYEDARYLADRDPVTGLLNHRTVHERLGEELSRARREARELSVVMMDLDGFKLFNDTYGHPIGDRVLREVATLLEAHLRTSDVLGRYGGDEFVAILPGSGIEEGRAMAERLRLAVAARSYSTPEGTAVPIGMSFGVSSYPLSGDQSQELIEFADANLYRSKELGGNRVTAGDGLDRLELRRLGTFGVLDGLVTAVDNKDHYTRRHSEEVTEYALAIARALGLSEETQRSLRIAGLLHDVGKIGVPDWILRKPGRLDDEEESVVRQHVLLGEMIIKDVPGLGEVIGAVGSHHERVDGGGYPRGLRGEAIPLLGRILAVADAYSAMTSNRPYRKALTPDEARAELLRCAGSQLDPIVVRAFVGLADLELPRDLLVSSC